MRCLSCIIVVMALLTPRSSSSLQLHWNSGSTDLSFVSATRCTLVVQTGSLETRLPSEWRLIWVADSSSIQFVPTDSINACLLEQAQVSRIEAPATPADSAANQMTAQFCAAGIEAASVAWQVLDLPAGGQGKLRAIALDPTDPDSNRVVESNEVTYNGGVAGSYPPVILRSSSVHNSLRLQVTAVGSGLSAASSMNIRAFDAAWALPLTITDRSDVSLTGVASVAALLPACETSIGSESGAMSGGSLAADVEPAEVEPLTGCQATFNENLLQPPPNPLAYTVQPKDFAFAHGFVDESTNQLALHFFYIRHNYWYYQPPDSQQRWQPDLDEKNLGHIWTYDFDSWYGPGGLNMPDTSGFTVRPGRFDELHVWAPSIVHPPGPFFYLFYTGVRNEGGRHNQRIGVAISTRLDTLVPRPDPVLTTLDIPWASKDSPAYDGQQLRDPFVMEDPAHPGHWLMYFVAVDSLTRSKMAVGVARSTDMIHWIADPDSLGNTQRATSEGPTTVIESPHVFRRHGQWWLPYTVNGNHVFFETTSSFDPTETDASQWTNPVRVMDVTQGQPSDIGFWHASEYLRIGPAEYLAAFDDATISIAIRGIFPPTHENAVVDSFRLSCPQPPDVSVQDRDVGQGVKLTVSRLRWGVPEVNMRVELPQRMRIQLAIYDIAGRKRAKVLDQDLPVGESEITWDGRDLAGVRVASGVYFIRLTCARAARVSKIVLLK